MSTSRRIISRAWIPLATWMVSVLVAEAAFRALGKHPPQDVEGVYAEFGDRSFRLRPRCASFENWFSGEFRVYTDDLGLRCGAGGLGGVSARSTVDVLVLGDSQGFGNGVDFEVSVVGALQAEAATDGLIVANASVGAHFLRNQLELARWLQQEYELKVNTVLLLLTPRMIALPDGYSRAFIGNDGRLYRGPPTLPMRLRAWLKTHSSTYIIMRDAYRGTFRDSTGELGELDFYRRGGEDERRRESLKKALAALRDWTAAIDASLAVAYLPLIVELRMGELTLSIDGQEVQVSGEDPYELAKEVLSSLQIPLINARPSLERLEASGDPLQLRGDFHYNVTTSQAVGRQIWVDLLSLDLGG